MSLFNKNRNVLFQVDPHKQPLEAASYNLAHGCITLRVLMWHRCEMTPRSFQCHFKSNKLIFYCIENMAG